MISLKIMNEVDTYNRMKHIYEIKTLENTKTSKMSFAKKVAETLNSPKGWHQIVTFQEGKSDSLIIILAPAADLPSYSKACSIKWSCRVGKYVIINEDRWLGASESWNSEGGKLRDYQHMVVNHEVGHWLGLEHASPDSPGRPAPLMQQQSISLQGCTPNPWPLPSELGVLQ